MVGVAVGTMALITVLSAFNGIDGYIGGMLSNFDPDLKITIAEGKSFTLNDANFDAVKQLDGVEEMAEVVEENALLRYENRQKYAVVKGVPEDYASFSGLDSILLNGEFMLKKGKQNYAVIGEGVRYDLSIGLTFVSPIYVNVPRKDVKSVLNLEQALNRGHVFPSGIFSVEQEIDSKYIIVPIDFARSLFEMEGRISSLELKLEKGANINEIKSQVKKLLGEQFVIQDRYEQHEFLYRVMRSEKWSSFLILSFILVIASFNLLGSLTMIIIDKKDDIKILKSMGASKKLIRQIFLFEGWLVSFSGAIVGLILGIALVWAQKNFELLKLGDGTLALSAYPVELQSLDIFATFLIVLLVGFFAAWYPVRTLSVSKL